MSEVLAKIYIDGFTTVVDAHTAGRMAQAFSSQEPILRKYHVGLDVFMVNWANVGVFRYKLVDKQSCTIHVDPGPYTKL